MNSLTPPLSPSVSRTTELTDWDTDTFVDGAPVVWSSAAGKFVGNRPISSDLTVTVTAAVGGHRLVFRETDGSLVYADSGSPDHADRQLWMTLNATGSGGGEVRLQNYGVVVEPSWSWDPSRPVFLGTGGGMTQTVPPLSASGPVRLSWMIGRAISPTELDLSFRDPITA